MQTYVVASQRNLQVARNRQFAECMKEGRPFITVGNKRRFSNNEEANKMLKPYLRKGWDLKV